MKTWKRRYCILKANQLFYYGEMSETTAYGVMDLAGYTFTSGASKSGKYYFSASPPRDSLRTFYFFVESEGERSRYVQYVYYALGLLGSVHDYNVWYTGGWKQ